MTRRAFAVLTIGAGALMVVLGSLFPLYGVETFIRPGVEGSLSGGVQRLVALTGWEYVQEPPPQPRPAGTDFEFPVYGYGVVFAAVLAGVGALLQLRSPLLAAIGRFGVLAAVGVVVGTLWAALETLRTLFGINATSVSVTTDEFVGTGTWLMGASALAMLVGAVAAHDWPARVPRPTGVSVYQVDDDDTPPFGIAIPVSELDVPPGDPAPPAGPVAPPVAELPPLVDLPRPHGAPDPAADERRHPTGGNPSTVD
ncbi:hypothetical protein ADK67_36595 [Saccharothrix sp. NRRL B-16348]|uniref:hypothetical protein n=1 Tax=Saccharothrix sp. NRRL B-16348 TaxID=1415542 RepID=UPI0006AE832F|nr:hypothetical protein [Saccharothrix sp. NRRL B-16348]KOX18500.1 hypothetical protein ADK67_36595 [Saccharothrix sp. NRRL B-16348]